VSLGSELEPGETLVASSESPVELPCEELPCEEVPCDELCCVEALLGSVEESEVDGSPLELTPGGTHTGKVSDASSEGLLVEPLVVSCSPSSLVLVTVSSLRFVADPLAVASSDVGLGLVCESSLSVVCCVGWTQRGCEVELVSSVEAFASDLLWSPLQAAVRIRRSALLDLVARHDSRSRCFTSQAYPEFGSGDMARSASNRADLRPMWGCDAYSGSTLSSHQ